MKGMIRYLSDAELQRIHSATLEVLAKKGVLFVLPEALKVFKDAGFEVKGNIVKFTKSQVEDNIKKAPHTIRRRGLEEKDDVIIGDDNIYFGVGSLAPWILDFKSKNRRAANFQDMQKFMKLADGLGNYAISNSVVQPQEVPIKVMHALWNRNAALNTRKPSCCWYATEPQTAKDTIQIFAAASGGIEMLKKRKTWALTICPDSALTWGKIIYGLLEMAKAEVPIEVLPMPACGSNHPVTIAGALVQSNAEALSAIVLAELVNPGCPVIYAPSYGGILDMSFATYALGAPESVICAATAAQLGKWYGLPTDMMMGISDSRLPDAQAAYEKVFAILLPALAGADCITQAGALIDSGLSASYEQLIIDNEIVGQIFRILEGISIDTESLAVDTIMETPHGANYLSSEHTLNHFKKEFWFPQITERRSFEKWTEHGAKDILERANEKVEDILANHKHSGIGEKYKDEVLKVVKDIFKRENVDYGPFEKL